MFGIIQESTSNDFQKDKAVQRTPSKLLSLVFVVSTAIGLAADWPRFRGLDAVGVSDQTVPGQWSDSEDILWKTPLPGRGASSPITLGDRIFLTYYSGYGMNEDDPGTLQNLTRHLICIDRANGSVVWQKAAKALMPEQEYRGFVALHGYTSSTPASDGEAIYVYYGRSGVYAYRLDGEELVVQPHCHHHAVMGYGTDIGPEAICYRADLFEAAGLPSDRAEVAKLLDGGWDKYFTVGKDFVAKSDAAWFDAADGVFQGMINQIETPFENADGTPIPLGENTEIKKAYDQLITAAVTDDLSADLAQWSTDWSTAFQNDGFATMLCPGWMLGVIEGNAEGVEGWDIADVFPGGGGNWGGSYLTVPTQGAHPEEAKKLAAWLTAPEQQLKAFASKGTFPSQKEALASPELLKSTNAFFNDAPTGQILTNRANAVSVTPFKGPNYFAIRALTSDAINRADVDKTDDPEASWAKAVAAYGDLGLS